MHVRYYRKPLGAAFRPDLVHFRAVEKDVATQGVGIHVIVRDQLPDNARLASEFSKQKAAALPFSRSPFTQLAEDGPP